MRVASAGTFSLASECQLHGSMHGRLRAILQSVAILATFTLHSPAYAGELGGSATFVSDYDYRGVSQSASDPALQLGLDYTADHTHLEVWTSNVRFSDPGGFFDSRHVEIAYTADLSAGDAASVRYGLGVAYFTYPGWDPSYDYPEIAATVSHRKLVGTFHYTWNYGNDNPRLPAYYLEIDDSWPLPFWRISVTGHAGLSWGQYWSSANGGKYADASIGVRCDLHSVTLTLQFVDTAWYHPVPRTLPFSGKARFIVSVSIPVEF